MTTSEKALVFEALGVILTAVEHNAPNKEAIRQMKDKLRDQWYLFTNKSAGGFPTTPEEYNRMAAEMGDRMA